MMGLPACRDPTSLRVQRLDVCRSAGCARAGQLAEMHKAVFAVEVQKPGMQLERQSEARRSS